MDFSQNTAGPPAAARHRFWAWVSVSVSVEEAMRAASNREASKTSNSTSGCAARLPECTEPMKPAPMSAKRMELPEPTLDRPM